jgi:EAL and modified HD-GYP domain-containing signal transduction protein
MASILSRLPLTESLREALAAGRGPLGEILQATLAYERGDWENVRCLGLSRGTIRSAFLDAVAWVDGVDRELATLAA